MAHYHNSPGSSLLHTVKGYLRAWSVAFVNSPGSSLLHKAKDYLAAWPVAFTNSPGMSLLHTAKSYLTAWSVAIIGLSLSLVAFWGIQEQVSATRLLEFEWVAQNRHRVLKRSILNGLEAVESIRDLFLVSNNVGREEFSRFARSILNRSQGIQALTWIPKLSDLDDGVGRFPIVCAEAQESNEHLRGCDCIADPSHGQPLGRAVETGAMMVSGRMELGREDQYGFAAFLPVYRGGAALDTAAQREENLLGFATGIYCVSQLVRAATAVLEPRGVEFLVVDESAPEGERFLDFCPSRLSPPSLARSADWPAWSQDEQPRLTEAFQLADRTWSVTYAPTPEFRSAQGFEQGPWVVLASGILLTVLLNLYLLRIKQSIKVRAAMEDVLREREELFRQMTEAIQEVFWIQTPDSSEVLYVSPAYEKIWGRSCESLYREPSSFLDGIHPDDRDMVQGTLGEIPKEETEQVFRVVRPDGSTRWVRSRTFTVHNEAGDIYRIAGIREDITEIKQAEEALRRSERQLRTLFNQSPDIIKTVDRAGNILFMNRSTPHLSTRDAIGRNAVELLPPEYHERYHKALETVFGGGKDDHFQYALDDSTWWDVRLVPLRWDEAVTAAIVIETDVTEKRAVQAQAVRSARLASLGVLAAGVAHEINNPNSAIQFNASVLTRIADGALPLIRKYQEENGDFSLGGMPVGKALEAVPRLLSGIGNSAWRIQEIVGNLKHMARQDKGDLTHSVDVLEVLKAAISMVRNEIQKHTDQFTLDLPDALPRIKGNGQQLEQVFINIILNGLQALPHRGRGVHVSAFLDESAEDVIVMVRDEGEGIPYEAIRNVTEPFFTTKEETGGTGLGLSISNAIIRDHMARWNSLQSLVVKRR